MTEFILEIDWLTTKDFCDRFKVPHPYYTGDVKSSADQFIHIDAIKHKMFVEYAKFLKGKLNLNMFIGDKAIFPGFEKATNFENIPVLRMVGSNQVYAWLNTDNFEMNFPRQAVRIEDLVQIELKYTPKHPYFLLNN